MLMSAMCGPPWPGRSGAGCSAVLLVVAATARLAATRTASDTIVTGGGHGRVHVGDTPITSRQNRAMELCETVTPISRNIRAMVL